MNMAHAVRLPLSLSKKNVRAVLACLLITIALVEIALGLLAWDVVYFLGAPRIAVYWLQQQSSVVSVVCIGLAIAMYLPAQHSGKFTLVVVGALLVVLAMSPIGNLHTDLVGIRARPAADILYADEDPNIRKNAYLLDVYDLDNRYVGPIVTSASLNSNTGAGKVATIRFDHVFWVGHGERKSSELDREIAGFLSGQINGLKNLLYGLPYKQAYKDATNQLKKESEEFKHRQADVEHHGAKQSP